MLAYGNVLDAIGKTPMLELKRLDAGPCRLFVKLEFVNPGGSIKDRIGLAMITAAEREGKIRPGGMLIEATAGNTGLALALVAGQKGYRLTVVMPDKISREKIFHLRAMGAEVVITRSDVVKGHPEYYQDVAERMARETENAFFVNQFANESNPRAHEETTGPEIWEQMAGKVDAFIASVGTGGTLSGVGRYLRSRNPALEIVLADPEGSVLAHYVETGELGALGSWLVEGIGEDFVPPVCDLSIVSEAVTVADGESFAAARELLKVEGVLGGSSSGTNLAAALRYCRAQSTPKRVVTLLPDSGNKYLSKMYNDYWMIEEGFIEREHHGDLRDLIARPHAENAAVVVAPEDDLLIAYGRMKLYDISQLPVMADEKVVGIIDESDILLAVYGHEDHFKDEVAAYMTTELKIVPPDASIKSLVPMLDQGFVPIVMAGENFFGVITRIDLLNYLRRRLEGRR